MRWLGGARLIFGSILLAQLCAIGCAPPAGLQGSNSSTQTEQKPVPFHDENMKVAGPGDPAAGRESDSKSETALPFHDPESLPAGTMLAVRLRKAVFAGSPSVNGAFDAVVDEPVVIDGNSLVPLGTRVTGRVESAQASHLKRNRGYLRLTLGSIHLAGSDLPVQTSSLFVGGSAGVIQNSSSQPSAKPTNSVVELEKGRRLVFRLTAPVYISAPKQPSSGN